MADLVTDEMVDTYAVTGSYDTIAARVKERYGDLLDRHAFYQPHQPGLDDPRLARVVKEFNG
jgi:alkanesulfonate monooxygenase SsuD/methylene tetrahydromethanopterin reductase-like flavin-dependent oxidoreductase (luciferase family)